MKQRLCFYVLLSTLIFRFQLNAQPFQSLGNLLSFSGTKHGILIKTPEASVSIEVFNANVLHVRISKEKTNAFSYAVSGLPENTFFQVADQGKELLLKTDSMSVRITKVPLRLSFYDHRGRLICEEDKGFGVAWQGGEVTSYHSLLPDERFIGLGEKTGPLDKRGMAFTNWNTDDFAYEANADPLYVSIPFFIGLHDSLCYGLFLDNTYRSDFNFGASNDRFYSFSAAGGDMNYYVISSKDIPGILKNYSLLTGTMPMPAKWALGYQQCRWSYYPDSRVLEVAKTFREKNIPADVIYLDIDYMDQYKIFTWNRNRFSHPKNMIDSLKAMDFHTAVIIDPGIKVEKGYRQYDEGVAKDLFLKYPDGSLYTGQVWPGWCHFPDFTDPRVRKTWGSWFEAYVNLGIEGFWNDMNEPASWGNRFPDLVQFDYDGIGSSHLRAHNMYGLEMARATYEGTRKLMKDLRPLILTRAAFAGIQRYSAIWTGDNNPTDEHMLLGVRMSYGLGLTGVPFAGVDVGGFSGDPTPELFARWISIGAFTPFFRGHTMKGSKDAEPWAFGELVEQISRDYIGFRYRLMPYIYSCFHQAAETGLPLMRTLAIRFPFNAQVYDSRFMNEFTLGDALLISPVESTVNESSVYLPEGDWYNLWTGEKWNGNQTITVKSPLDQLPVFIRSGSIIPMQRLTQSLDENPGDTLIVHVFMGAGKTNFTLYDDDGVSYNFEKGAFSERQIQYDPANKKISITAGIGSFVPSWKSIKFVMHEFDPVKTFTINGRKYKTDLSFCKGLLQLNQLNGIPVQVLNIPWAGGPINITW